LEFNQSDFYLRIFSIFYGMEFIEHVVFNSSRFEEFLGEARNRIDTFMNAVNSETRMLSPVFTVVLGNEASDLDSIVSCLVLSFFYYTHRIVSKSVLPVINISRKDFFLRPEAVWLLKSLQIDLKFLIFLDEIDLFYLSRCGKLNLILTDHNVLAKHQESLSENIIEIVDHHLDEGRYLNQVVNDKRFIELVGSACTLVSLRILSYVEGRKWLSEIKCLCVLLLSAILLDTYNFDPIVKKGTPKDIEVVDELTTLLEIDLSSKNENVCQEFKIQLYTKLTAERFDQSSLSSLDLLRSDYKQFTMNGVEVGISSVRRSISEWIQKEDHLLQEIQCFALSKCRVDIFFVMTSFFKNPGIISRELIVFSGNEQRFLEAIDFLLHKTNLQLEPLKNESISQICHDNQQKIAFFSQRNIGATRKQLQPYLAQFYNGRGI